MCCKYWESSDTNITKKRLYYLYSNTKLLHSLNVISCWMNYFCSNLQQFKRTVSIRCMFRMFADRTNRLNQLNMSCARAWTSSLLAFTILVWLLTDAKSKPDLLSLFNEVFHQSSLTVKFDEMLWRSFHVCDNKCVHVNHLVFWLFDLAYHASCIRPWTCFVHEFSIGYCVVNFIVFCVFIKFIYKIGCFFAENGILREANHITCTVFFTLLIWSGVAKPLSPRRRIRIVG